MGNTRAEKRTPRKPRSRSAAASSARECGIRYPGELELWPIDRLKPCDRNPRTHTPGQIKKLVRSLQEFGWTNPILVDRAGHIVAGHGRLIAAREIGLKRVPVIQLGHLTSAQRRAYLIADNRLALDAGWDEDLLADELRELAAIDFDLTLTGFDLDELEEQLGGGGTGQGAGDPPVSPATPVSREGDLWLLGEHRLLCSREPDAATFERLLSSRDQSHGSSGCVAIAGDASLCDVVVRQWQEATRQPALLDGTGSTFDAVGGDRGAA